MVGTSNQSVPEMAMETMSINHGDWISLRGNRMGWLVVYLPTPLKNTSWDDEIPNWKNKNHVPNHQPVGM